MCGVEAFAKKDMEGKRDGFSLDKVFQRSV